MEQLELKGFVEGIAVMSSGKIALTKIEGNISEIVNIDFDPDYHIVITYIDGTQVTITKVDVDTDGKIKTVYMSKGDETHYVDCTYEGDYLRSVGVISISDIETLGIETTITTQDKTIMPGVELQTVTADEGFDALGTVTVNGSANLLAENIKNGVDIFGVIGTLTGGNGGGTEMMEQKVLWENESYQNSGDITLNDSIQNYDIIVVCSTTQAKSGLKGNNDIIFIPTSDITSSDSNYKYTNGYLYDTNLYYSVRYSFKNNNTIAILDHLYAGALNTSGICKVIGLKFTSRINYSSEEKCIGTWVDGKPLYQKTFTGLSFKLDFVDWRPVVRWDNVGTIISAFGIDTVGSGHLFYPMALGYNSDNYFTWCQSKAMGNMLQALTVQYTKTTD